MATRPSGEGSVYGDGNSASRGRRSRIRVSGRTAEMLYDARAGVLDCSDWDLEELMRGQRRAKNGRFVGRPPLMVPRGVYEELARRVQSQVAHQLRALAAEHIEPIYKKIMEAHSKGIDPEDVPGLRLQLEAAKDLMDRFIVSKTENIRVSGTMRHEEIIQSVTIDRSLDEESEDIVDAEVLEEEDWDEEDWDD